MQPSDVSTHADPSGNWEGEDHAGRPTRISWWKGLTLREAAWLKLTVLCIQRPQARGSQRDPRTSWFVWIGEDREDLPLIALGDRHQFSIEHGYRFDKQALLWSQPHVRTPEQFERWSALVTIVHNLLVLARSLVTSQLRPWENRHRVLSPQQVRRGMSVLLPVLGTPARPPQPRGKSPGRKKGVSVRKAKRFLVIHQGAKVPPVIPR